MIVCIKGIVKLVLFCGSFYVLVTLLAPYSLLLCFMFSVDSNMLESVVQHSPGSLKLFYIID
jgi:hypothetical protein